MKKIFRILLCLFIIGVAIQTGKFLIDSKPTPKANEIVKQLPFVDIIKAKKFREKQVLKLSAR